MDDENYNRDRETNDSTARLTLFQPCFLKNNLNTNRGEFFFFLLFSIVKPTERVINLYNSN